MSNAYEKASRQLDAARDQLTRIKNQAQAMIETAEEVAADAEARLKEFEVSPGIPKPECRQAAGPEGIADLTGVSQTLRYAEVKTDAGLVRVNTGLVSTGTQSGEAQGRQVVVVEVKPAQGGEWDADVVRGGGSRLSLRFVKRPEAGR